MVKRKKKTLFNDVWRVSSSFDTSNCFDHTHTPHIHSSHRQAVYWGCLNVISIDIFSVVTQMNYGENYVNTT